MTPLEQLALKKGKELVTAIGTLKNETVHQLLNEGTDAGLPKDALPYLLWTLVEGARYWPKMPTSIRFALMGADAVLRFGGYPPYHKSLWVPEGYPQEKMVDVALLEFGLWAKGPLTVMAYRKFQELTKKSASETALITGESDKDAVFSLRAAMILGMEKGTHWFSNGLALANLLSPFI